MGSSWGKSWGIAWGNVWGKVTALLPSKPVVSSKWLRESTEPTPQVFIQNVPTRVFVRKSANN